MDYKILIADDEPEIRNLLRLYLENEKYIVIEAEDGQRALDLLRTEQPALCILDIMMPKLDGYHVLQQIRKESNIPVIILSAKDADSEKILGLNLGADDYLAKPFNPLEAVARVNSNIRRFYSLGTKVVQEENLCVRDLVLNQDSCTLKKGDEEIQLTSVEYRIMELLMQHPGQVFSPNEIYEKVWNDNPFRNENTVAVHIRHLREKVEYNPAEPRHLKVVWGRGYKMEV